MRTLDDPAQAGGDRVIAVTDPQGGTIARFAWKPTKPGAAIVQSVVPFIAVALAGFALLVGLVIRHMRRTAQEIAAGERQLRHLALHDPVCGLPNRIYFGDRLERRDRRSARAAARPRPCSTSTSTTSRTSTTRSATISATS